MESLMRVVSSASRARHQTKNRIDLRNRFSTKTDVGTKRQLVHKRVHVIGFFVLICCLVITEAAFIRPPSLEPAC